MTSVRVLDRVMALLTAFPDGTRRWRPEEIAEEVGIPLASARRLMGAMAEHGLLDHDEHGYRLGMTLMHLGGRVAGHLDLPALSLRHLRWLRDVAGENAELHVVHGAARVPIEVVEGPATLRPVGQVGVPLPVHCGASAQVLLAEVGPLERAALIEESRRHYGSLPGFDQASWEANLDNVHARGWAASTAEREPGVSAIAAPVQDRRGVTVAAVVVSGPSVRMDRHDREALRGAVMTAAARISRDYGAPLEPDGRGHLRKTRIGTPRYDAATDE